MLIGVLVAVLVVLAAAPTLLSTAPARNLIVGAVNDRIPGTVGLERLSLSWLGGQVVEGVTLAEPSGERVLRLETLRTGLTLWQALLGRLTLAETELRGLDLALRVDAEGRDNLQAALGPPDPAADADAGAEPLVVPITGTMVLEDARITVDTAGTETVTITPLRARLSIAQEDRSLDLELDAAASQAGLTGELAASGRIRDWLAADGTLTPARAAADLDARAEALPLVAVDAMLGLDGVLVAALGERLNAEIALRDDTLTLRADAAYLQAQLSGRIDGERFALTQPGSARWTARPELVRLLGGADGIGLAQPVPLTLAIERLEVPARAERLGDAALNVRLAGRGAARLTGIGAGEIALAGLQASVASERLADALQLSADAEVTGVDAEGRMHLGVELAELLSAQGEPQPAAMRVDAEAALRDIPTALADRLLGLEGALADALGPRLTLTAQARTEQAGRVAGDLGLESAALTSRFEVALTPADRGQRFELEGTVRPQDGRSGRVTAEGTLSEARRDAPQQLAVTAALEGIPVELIALGGFEPAQLAWLGTPLNADLEADLALAEPLRGQLRLGLDSSTLTSAFDLALTPADHGQRFELDGTLGPQGGEPARVTAAGTLSGGDGDAPPQLALDASLSAVPLELIALAGVDRTQLALLGSPPDAEVNAELALAEAPRGRLRLGLDAANLQLAADLDVAEQATLRAPASMTVQLTPEMYATLLSEQTSDGQTPIRLTENARIEATIDALRVPLTADDPALPGVEGRFRIPRLGLAHAATGERFGIDGLTATLAATEPAQRIGLTLEGEMRSDGDPGRLDLQAELRNALTAAGEIAYERLAMDLQGRVDRLPTSMIDHVLAMDGGLLATLGTPANLRLDSEVRQGAGPVTLDVSAPHTRAEIPARWEQGTLTLREPLVAEVDPRPEFGTRVLAQVHPLFASLYGGEHPLRLTVPAEGFRVPVRDYALEHVEIPAMRLELGTLTLERGPLLQGLMALAGRIGGFQPSEGRWQAEFTPAELSVSGGGLEYRRRVDLLLDDRLHLASWGRVDLAGGTVEMVLGLMPHTLEEVFGLEVEGAQALSLPITGSLTSPRIDFTRAATQLARLRAQRRAGQGGGLLGALASAVSGQSLTQLPAASVDPLPWAARLQGTTE